jgi:uncharacterized protein (TIGR03067 family)
MLQGAWKQTRLEADGVVNPPDDHGAPDALTTVAGSNFSVRTIEGSLLLEGAFVPDASTSPKSITWIDSVGEDKGKPLPASYTLEDDRFKFTAGNGGAPRPPNFIAQLARPCGPSFAVDTPACSFDFRQPAGVRLLRDAFTRRPQQSIRQ